ncbi:MAG: spore germination protein [bacterium]|nr:spore germination protein [bacterium]
MQKLYNDLGEITAKIDKSLDANIKIVDELFQDCGDVVKRRFTIGGKNTVDIYFVYIDNMINKQLLEDDTLRYLMYKMDDMPEENKFEYVKDKGLRSADKAEITDMQQAVDKVTSGDTAIFVDGFEKALTISIRGMANRGVQSTTNEVTVRGSNESFSEGLFINRVLLRKRIKDPRMKMVQLKVGTRTKTDVAIVYIDDIVKPEVVEDIKSRLDNFVVDGIFDSGMLEQLTERNHYSPFPEFQYTERPDKAASALTEGRVCLIVDNSPMVLLLPTTLNAFYQASDDYYSRWEVATFARILRYVASFIAVALPGLYITIVNFQAELVSSSLALSFASAREGVPFSILLEVIIMEVAFELLLEAGIRLPGPMGNTIGIVGGLIIGDAAVNANLASPMVVIVVALTAITAFTIPNEAFSAAFRLIRYMIIFLSAALGLYGFILGIVLLFIHLCSLTSFGTPYLKPFVAGSIDGSEEYKDSIIKAPINKLKIRPSFAKSGERRRLLMEKDKNKNMKNQGR